MIDNDRIVEEILKKNPKVAGIVKDARLFDALRTNPAWQRLHEMVTAKREKWMEGVVLRFMGPKKHWPEPEEIAFYQGFYGGAMFVLSHPEHAEHSLERAARLAWVIAQEEPTQEDRLA